MAQQTIQDLWVSDMIQFPRLIAEINTTIEFTDEQWEALSTEMGLGRAEIEELFERATTKFDQIKARYT